MKAVMLSIKPKWCELIASGKKTIEVRKNAPKGKEPFKVYIYQTKKKWIYKLLEKLGLYRGKVIGDFVCDKIEQYVNVLQIIGEESIEIYRNGLDKLNQMCLSEKEFYEYGGAVFGYKQHIPNDLKQGKNIFGWHISDLKIYDKPKELGEFKNLQGQTIKRPFQSWGYVCSNE